MKSDRRQKTRDRAVFSWREGRYLDLWSIVHLFTGAGLGLCSLVFGVDLYLAFGATVVVLVLYEFGEMIFDIIEAPENIIMDVFLGAAGFLAVATLLSGSDRELQIRVLFAVVVFNTALAITGWRKYVNRDQAS